MLALLVQWLWASNSAEVTPINPIIIMLERIFRVFIFC